MQYAFDKRQRPRICPTQYYNKSDVAFAKIATFENIAHLEHLLPAFLTDREIEVLVVFCLVPIGAALHHERHALRRLYKMYM